MLCRDFFIEPKKMITLTETNPITIINRLVEISLFTWHRAESDHPIYKKTMLIGSIRCLKVLKHSYIVFGI